MDGGMGKGGYGGGYGGGGMKGGILGRGITGRSTNQLLKRLGGACTSLLPSPFFLTKLKMESKSVGFQMEFLLHSFFQCFRLNFNSVTHLRIVFHVFPGCIGESPN